MIDMATVIKERVSCRDFADFIGLRVNRAGFAVCPFHGDRDASLKIYDGNRGWCCFGCHAGGDVIAFAERYYGVAFKDALKRLNADFGLGLDVGTEDVDRMAISVHIAKLKAQRMKEQRERDALEAKYWKAYDRWLESERLMTAFEPKDRDAEFSPEFCAAILCRNYYQNDLNELDARRHRYEK